MWFRFVSFVVLGLWFEAAPLAAAERHVSRSCFRSCQAVRVYTLLTLRIVTAPDVDAVPSPDDTVTAPPVAAVDLPADACSDPPAPLVPLPTDTTTSPPRPFAAAAPQQL